MAFGSSDVDITVGADTSAAQAGLASLRNEASKVGSSLSSAFGSMISPAALITSALTFGVKAVIDYGNHVYELGKRFNVGTTEIQQFSKAAERNGLSTEHLAGGFNKLEVALSKARGGSKEFQVTLENLNIKNWANESLGLADAALMIGTSSMNAADMVKVLGKTGTEWRETLRALVTGTEELGAAIDPGTIEKMHKLDVRITTFEQHLRLFGMTAVGVLASFDEGINKAGNSWRALFGEIVSDPRSLGEHIPRPPQEQAAPDTGPANVEPKEVITDEDIKRAFEYEDIRDKTIAAEEAAREAALTKEEHLNELINQRSDLEDRLLDVIAREGDQTELALELRRDIANVTTEIIPLQNQLADAAEREAKAAEHAADAQERKNQAIQEENDRIRRAGDASVSPHGGVSPNQLASMAAAGISFGGTAFGLALAASGGSTDSPEFLRAYQHYQALDNLQRLTGRDPYSFADRARASAAMDRWGTAQNRVAGAEADQSVADETAYWQSIAAGRPAPPGNPFTNMYGGTPYLPTGAGGAEQTFGQLTTILQLMQSALSRLDTIAVRLTPLPGGI